MSDEPNNAVEEVVNKATKMFKPENPEDNNLDGFNANEAKTNLFNRINQKIEGIKDEEAPKEIADLINLIPNLKTKSHFDTAEVIYNALFCEKLKPALAKEILINLQSKLKINLSSALPVLVGLFVVFLFVIILKMGISATRIEITSQII